MADSNSGTPTSSPNSSIASRAWERSLIEKTLLASVQEQRRARRWSIFFKLLMVAYLALILIAYLADKGFDKSALGGDEKHTALVELKGVISADSEADADSVIDALETAFEDEATKGVILRINSPGGSPVQAGRINDAIARLRKEHENIPLYAVIEDLCASGGYYVAVSADKIYADKASLVGSIGVIMGGFGFVDVMEKLGVERRLLTAGEHKALRDPFSKVDQPAEEHLQTLLDDIHKQFIEVVKQGRGDRLKQDPKLFTGLVWTGEQAQQLGLVDELRDINYVAKEVIGAEDIVEYKHKRDVLERLAERLGTGVAKTLKAEISNLLMVN